MKKLFKLAALLLLAACSIGTQAANTVGQRIVPMISSALLDGQVRVQLQLPSEYQTKPSAFQLQTTSGRKAFDTNGQTSAQLGTRSSQLGIAVNNKGKPILMGWLGRQPSIIDAQSTAEVLVFYLLGVGYTPSYDFDALAEDIRSHKETARIAGYIEAALKNNPASLNALLLVIKDDVRAAIERIKANPGSFVLAGPLSLINPSNGKSGIEISELDSDTFQITNNYRRRAHAWVDRVSYVDQDGTEHAYEKAITNFSISPTSGFDGTIKTIYNAATVGTKTWIPVISAPFDLPHTPANARRTNYKISVLGPGATEGDLNSFSAARKKKLPRLYALATIDATLPVITSIVMPALGVADESLTLGLSKLATDPVLIDAIVALPNFSTNISKGNLKEIIHDTLKLVATNAQLQQYIINQVGNYLREKVDGTIVIDEHAFRDSAKTLLKAITIVDAGGTAIDYGKQLSDYYDSNNGDIWEVSVGLPKVTLTPNYGVIRESGDFVRLTVKVLETPQSGDTYKCVWKMRNAIGGNLEGKTTDFETSYPATVTYRASPDSIGNATEVIEVEVFKFDTANPQGVSLGIKSATIDVLSATPKLFDRLSSVEPGKAVNISVQVHPSWPHGPVVYTWSITNNFGNYAAGTRPEPYSSTSTIRYKARKPDEGTDTVRVKAYGLKNGEYVYLGEDQGEIRVEFEPTVVKGTREYMSTIYTSGNYQRYAGRIVVKFPKVDYAKSYSITAQCTDPNAKPCSYNCTPTPCSWGQEVKLNPSSLNIADDWRWQFPTLPLPPNDEYWFVFSAAGGPADNVGENQSRQETATSGYRWTAEVDR